MRPVSGLESRSRSCRAARSQTWRAGCASSTARGPLQAVELDDADSSVVGTFLEDTPPPRCAGGGRKDSPHFQPSVWYCPRLSMLRPTGLPSARQCSTRTRSSRKDLRPISPVAGAVASIPFPLAEATQWSPLPSACGESRLPFVEADQDLGSLPIESCEPVVRPFWSPDAASLGSAQRRSSRRAARNRLPYPCCGWSCVVPVRITETAGAH